MESRAIGQLTGVSRFLRVVLQHPSGIDNRLAALGRFLVRQTHKRVVGGPLIVRWEGLRLAVAPHASAAAAAYYLGRPDWWEFDFLEHFLRPADHVLDVGANVGVYSLFMAKLVGRAGAVIACEPDPESVIGLRENLVRNHLLHVRVAEAAVGDREGPVSFLSGRGTQSRVGDEAEGATLAARMTTVDALCREAAPVFIKVDVEGFEDAVVRGAHGIMQRGLPKVWQLEVDPGRAAQHARLEAALKPFGYRSFVWEPAARALRPADFARPRGNNLLAIADVAFVDARLRGEPA
jgi:FkbM family methyltransferase